VVFLTRHLPLTSTRSRDIQVTADASLHLLASQRVYEIIPAEADDESHGISQQGNLRAPNGAVAVQQRLVSTLDALREETARLEAIYQQKLEALDDLKKSLLHQAFTGAL
jgi:hypothetical protein